MPYIGQQPEIGAYKKLDSITAVNGQAAYTMNNGGSAFTAYNNVNQFLVSLNGVLQAPTDSFTVSGSTLTFASNLATGDVIDFVIVLGNTLDLGTPSDNTVSLAKLTASGTKDATTFLRGDNSFAVPSGGKIGQVVSATSNSSLVSTAGSFVDLTGVTVNITPSATSSKVLIITSLPLFTNGGVDIYATILRGTTNLGNATTGFGRAGKQDGSSYELHTLSAINYLDSPSTTSSTTYKVQIKTSNGGTHASNTPTSVITAMEVLA